MKGTKRGSHYDVGGISTIAFIKAKLTPEQYEGWLLANVIKYVSRYQHKDGLRDLVKARDYLEWLIEHVEKKHRRTEGGTGADESEDYCSYPID